MDDRQELIPHLFRTEYRKIVSVLYRHFGFEQLEIAEDIASDTFLTASETWGLKGVPPNPTAWLYTVAKNKARNYLHHDAIFENNVAPVFRLDRAPSYEPEIDLSPQNINDSQLQMMFSICHPGISKEAQIGLSLNILCGFGIQEIANAFLTGKETITKRLYRAKEKLRRDKIKIELPSDKEIEDRLEAVLTTIYLLFNEGYYSISHDATLQKDLCLEAMRLCYMLVENKETNMPQVNALLALMCFQSSRFEARIDENRDLILYEDQDTNLWDSDLIRKGEYFLNCSANGDKVSKYHLEAAIAFWQTHKENTREKWENILQLYNRLLQIAYSPIAALNRTYALSKANGKSEAITEAEKLGLVNNQFYFTLLGELYRGIDNEKARLNLEKALTLAKTQRDKHTIRKRIDAIG